MMPTLEAKVYVRAMFSSRKYRVTPVRPAPANRSSFFQPESGSRRGFRHQRKAYPITKRVKSTVTGVKSRRSTLVDTKVVPQIRMVIRAAAWPSVRWREFIGM